MEIGTGIAVAGVWLFAAAALMSKNTSSTGALLAMVIAIGVTLYLK